MTAPDVLALLRAHRSIRRFQDRPVPDEMLNRILDAARHASTSSNMQAYSIIVVRDGALRERLFELCGRQEHTRQAGAFCVFCADLYRLDLARRMHGLDPLDARPIEALLIATVDTALVLQNAALAAESLGLGICMIGAIRNHPREVCRLLRLPRLVYPVAGFCVGYPAADPAPRPRLPLRAVVHYDRYLDDDAHREAIREYDAILASWYEHLGLHPEDPRWSAMMAARSAGFRARAELNDLLHEQGFGVAPWSSLCRPDEHPPS